jgi:RNA polymerase sigma factor (sigma-70 family)
MKPSVPTTHSCEEMFSVEASIPTAPSISDKAPASWEEAYRHYAQTVARWAWHLGGPEIEVEDAVQEIFLVVSRQFADFRGDARFSTWLYSITRKIVANHRNRHRWRFWLGRKKHDELSLLPSRLPDPLSHLEQEQARAIFYRLLRTLPEKYRSVLVLFELEEMSTQEIANLCESNVTTIKVRLHRAKKMFFERYQRFAKEHSR